jgi:putative ABC transport system substrate-binding protein
MDRRAACLSLAAFSALAALRARAQSGRTARVAWVTVERTFPDSPYLLSFRSSMQALGWVEGRNLVLDTWWGEGSAERLKKLVPEIVASRPDVIVATGGPTVTLIDPGVQIPIVFTYSADVVVGKVVESWARPGGNRTGISFFSLELGPKRLELMKELFPGMKRVASVGWPPHAGELIELQVIADAAAKLGLEHRYWGANSVDELDAAFEAIAQWKADAIHGIAGRIVVANAERFAAFAARSRIPTVSSWAVVAERGNLMTYGPVLRESFARLASFVDRVLKGAKPAEMPVERPTKFELVVNLKAAKALGIAIPQSILLRADRVIE